MLALVFSMKFVQKSDISSFNILAIPDAPYYSDQLGVACVQFRVAQPHRVRLHQVHIHTHYPSSTQSHGC